MLYIFNKYVRISKLHKVICTAVGINDRKKIIINSPFFRKHYFRSLLNYVNSLNVSLLTPADINFYKGCNFILVNLGQNNPVFYCRKLFYR